MAGTVDGAAAAVEAGAVSSGKVAEMTGTSTVLLMPNTKGIIETSFIAMKHALPGQHLILGALASTGASLRWFRDEFCQAEKKLAEETGEDAYDLMTRGAAEAPPGSQGIVFLPYMMGERSPIWNSNARGVFFGLSLSASRADLVRAILEGTSFALRHNIEIAAEAGIEINEIRSVGGGTRSRLWNQVKADVLGIPVNIPEASTGASFGAAVLAGYGMGLFPDIENTLNGMIRVKERFEPRQESSGLYSDLYSIYRDVYRNLENEFERLASAIQKR